MQVQVSLLELKLRIHQEVAQFEPNSKHFRSAILAHRPLLAKEVREAAFYHKFEFVEAKLLQELPLQSLFLSATPVCGAKARAEYLLEQPMHIGHHQLSVAEPTCQTKVIQREGRNAYWRVDYEVLLWEY